MMRIKRIAWWNYRGLEDGEIIAEGSDVIIRGQNGVGKTSIASIVPFVLFGKETDSARRYEDGEAVRDDGLFHGATVEFDNGKTFCREVDGKNSHCYIDGERIALQKNFNAEVAKFLNGGDEYALNPFLFCEGKSSAEQRNILEKLFGTVSDKDILGMTEYEELAQVVGDASLDRFITSMQKNIKNLLGQVKDIPSRIDELNRQLESNPYDEKLAATLQTERDEFDRERKTLQSMESEASKKLSAVKTERETALANSKYVADLEWQRKFLARDVADKGKELIERREEFKAKRAEKPGICPTCKQRIPETNEAFKTRHDQELAELTDKGLACVDEYEALKEKLKTLDDEIAAAKKLPMNAEQLAALDGRIKTLEQQVAEEKVQRKDRLAKLNAEIAEVDKDLSRLANVLDVQKRIDELRDEEKELNQRVVDLEYFLNRAKDARNRKVELTEGQIADHFEHVKFKMFELVVSTGEYKATCEAMLHGVPYSVLSKGERLKVVLDIFRALQKKIGVEMPLMIDDAESYTRNSFVDLPNQLWLFKVSDEEQLVIEVKKEARRAA